MRRAKQALFGTAMALSMAAAAVLAPALGDARELRSLSGSYLAGQFASQTRDVDQAARYFADALEQDPNNSLLLERAFVAELGAGNIMRAEVLAKRLVAINSRHRLAHIVLGVSDMRRGAQAEARKHFEQAAYTPIGELTSGLLTAWSYAAQRDLLKATKALNILDRNESFGIYKTFHEALIADLLGVKAKAETLYKKAYDESSNSLRIVQAYGNFLERQGNVERARDIYETFLTVSPDHPVVAQTLARIGHGQPAPFIGDATDGAAEALFGLASALTDESGIDLALTYARLTLSLKPSLPAVQTLLGDIFENMKQYRAAIAAYEKVQFGSALRPNADIRIAINLSELDQKDEARAHLERLIKRDPKNYEALVTLGTILRSQSKFAEAATYYTKALDTVGELTQRNWSVLYFRGISYERSKQWDKAEADFLKALELEPDQPLVLNYLGYSWLEQDRNLDEAMKMIEKAVEQRPNDGFIIDSLGWAYYKRGDYARAVEELERAVELQPNDAAINDHLGDAYWRVGRKLEAKFQWQHAKDSQPEPDLLKSIEAKLANGLPDAAPAPEVATPNSEKRS
ncbi:tetratricopeptide repeat protein [Rhodoligotrophos defluvii]|uniref:tetratricopeptide repeat protein n=1 Tax=Rhodoligotrophos defluvii TaxID=2561934 RepID=UPI0010C99438|nr:tetratricopeptide repeat protein [Rhodoligotrophos defluvii]